MGRLLRQARHREGGGAPGCVRRWRVLDAAIVGSVSGVRRVLTRIHALVQLIVRRHLADGFNTDKPMQTPIRRAYSIPEVMCILGLCRDSVYKLIREGRLRARKIGRRTVVLETDIQAFLEELPALGAA